jgi:hypothetical protein
MAQQFDEQFLQQHYEWFQKSYHWHDKAVGLRVLAHEPRPPRRARSTSMRPPPVTRFAANVPGLEKVPSPRCLMTSIGNERANAISEREPNNEIDRESISKPGVMLP